MKPEGRCNNGYFFTPTVIEGLSYDYRTNQEEISGSMVTVMPFDIAEEVLEMANSTRYGLAITIWTQNLNTAHNYVSPTEKWYCLDQLLVAMRPTNTLWRHETVWFGKSKEISIHCGSLPSFKMYASSCNINKYTESDCLGECLISRF